MNTTATMNQRAIDEIAIFLPPAARNTLTRAVDMLESANVGADDFVRSMLDIGESVIQHSLDWTIDELEELVARIYELGLMERLGNLNSFARDGAEIGIQLGLNTLKALEPADVAKLVGLAVIVFTVPNLIVLNGPDFLEIAVDLLQKLWNLP